MCHQNICDPAGMLWSHNENRCHFFVQMQQAEFFLVYTFFFIGFVCIFAWETALLWMLLTMKVVFELHEGIFKCDLDHLCLRSIQATLLDCRTACRMSVSLNCTLCSPMHHVWFTSSPCQCCRQCTVCVFSTKKQASEEECVCGRICRNPWCCHFPDVSLISVRNNSLTSVRSLL